MAEDRVLDDAAAAIAALRAELDDLKSTANATAHLRPTGTVEWVLRTTPAPGTLFLHGQTVSRVQYLRLWAHVQEQGLVGPGLFTVGDGSTTFGLPDTRDRFMAGAGGTIALGGTGGSATRTLTIANLPAHGHGLGGGTVASASHTHASDALHSHSIGGDGAHGGHNSGSFPVAGGSGATVAATTQNSGGGHDHGGGTGGAGAHNHGPSSHGHDLSGTTDNAGSGTAFDNRPPFLGVNVAVWA